MASNKFDFRAGDTLTKVRFTIFDKQTKQVLPLDGTHTAQLVWSIDEAASVSQPMTVLTGVDDGKVEYQFQTGELKEGTIEMQVKITETASGNIATNINTVKKIVGPVL